MSTLWAYRVRAKRQRREGLSSLAAGPHGRWRLSGFESVFLILTRKAPVRPPRTVLRLERPAGGGKGGGGSIIGTQVSRKAAEAKILLRALDLLQAHHTAKRGLYRSHTTRRSASVSCRRLELSLYESFSLPVFPLVCVLSLFFLVPGAEDQPRILRGPVNLGPSRASITPLGLSDPGVPFSQSFGFRLAFWHF